MARPAAGITKDAVRRRDLTADGGRMQAVLWDMDGTLMDPNGSIRGALNAAVTWGGHAPFGDDEVLIGMPLREILRSRTQDAAHIDAMVDEFRRVSYEESWRLARWYPGVRDAVGWCRAAGLRTAVVTTKGQREAEVLLGKLGDLPLFDAVVGDDDRRAVKPHPAPVLEACRLLGVPPSLAVMVGDTRYDVEAGQAAGCPTIGVTWGHGSGAHGVAAADHTVSDAPSLVALLDRLRGGHNP